MMTPARARAIAEDIALGSVEQEVRTALLEYAAMVERADERRGMFAANYGRIDYEVDGAIVDEIDYILRGDAGKEKK